MAFTIHVNGRSNSLVHKGSLGIAKSTLPDVCKTPSPGGPVPIPYPVIVSMSSDLKKGTKTVKVEGKKSAAIKGSEFSRCTGDEPGTAGGVKSSTNMKEATWILYSFDVKLEGKNACRLSDKMMMNHGNTVCLAGAGDTDVDPNTKDEKEKCPVCDKGENPTPGEVPEYIDPPRVPLDRETLIGREKLIAKGNGRVKGAKIFSRGKGVCHRDTLHKGKGAEIEVYNKKGSTHIDAICAHCGAGKGKQDDKKKCNP